MLNQHPNEEKLFTNALQLGKNGVENPFPESYEQGFSTYQQLSY